MASLMGWFASSATADTVSTPAFGSAWTWGTNEYGQLGNNSTTNSSVPVAVNTTGTINGAPVTAISAGVAHTCAVAGGKAYCWGRNTYGQLGNQTTDGSSVPVAVSTTVMSGTVTAISIGILHTCAVADGKAYCWGYNYFGGLGNNTTTDSAVPVEVTTNAALSGPVTDISAGGLHTCALAGGQVSCWGNNRYGQLGNNSTTNSAVPVEVTTNAALSGPVTDISAADSYTCALAGGTASCWGYNRFSQLGNNSTTNSAVPVAVTTNAALSGPVTDISAGNAYACALAGGKAACWGYNGDGQLGNNSTTGSGVPVAVTTNAALSGPVTDISAGVEHTCAIAGGKASCWGTNEFGQLGNNTTADSAVPVAVTTSNVLTGTVTMISAGTRFTAAVSVWPILSVSSDPVSFSDQLVGTSSSQQTVTVMNTGGAPLNVSSVDLADSNPGQFSTGASTCNTPVAPSGTCTVKVAFSPTSTGDKTAELSFTTDAPGSPQMVALSGTGIQPEFTAIPNLVPFGPQLVGTGSTEQTVTVINSGSANLTVSGVSLTGANSGQFTKGASTCTTPVAPAGQCTVKVAFSPTSTGNKTASLSFTTDAPGSPQTVALTGTGTQPGLGADPDPVDFADQVVGSSSTERTVTVTNTGTAPLNVTGVDLGGSNPGQFSKGASTCTTPVAPAGTCTVKVTFSPTSTGNKTADLRFTSDAPDSPHAVTLTGTGTQPGFSAAPNPVAFADQVVATSSTEQTMTVTNTGTAPLDVSAVSLTGDHADQFAKGANTCDSPVAPAATCTVTVTFTPTSPGDKTAQLSVITDAPGGPQMVALTGTGTATPATPKKKQTLRPGLPQRIKLSGLTVITPANALTNAGQRVRTLVRGGPTNPTAAGDARYYVVVRGPEGKVSVRTFGRTDLKLRVTQTAPATTGYTAFRRAATYLGGKKQ